MNDNDLLTAANLIIGIHGAEANPMSSNAVYDSALIGRPTWQADPVERTMRGRLPNAGSWKRPIGALVVVLALGVLHAAPAFADDDDDGDDESHLGHWEQPDVIPGPPPVVYYGAAPQVVFAPAPRPVYYAPPALQSSTGRRPSTSRCPSTSVDSHQRAALRSAV
jgi:hypothetical protein